MVQAIDLFKNILTVDPCRLDNLDTFSNLLYVREMKTELADLAHKVVLIDKYRVETCCVIGKVQVRKGITVRNNEQLVRTISYVLRYALT